MADHNTGNTYYKSNVNNGTIGTVINGNVETYSNGPIGTSISKSTIDNSSINSSDKNTKGEDSTESDEGLKKKVSKAAEKTALAAIGAAVAEAVKRLFAIF